MGGCFLYSCLLWIIQIKHTNEKFQRKYQHMSEKMKQKFVFLVLDDLIQTDCFHHQPFICEWNDRLFASFS